VGDDADVPCVGGEDIGVLEVPTEGVDEGGAAVVDVEPGLALGETVVETTVLVTGGLLAAN